MMRSDISFVYVCLRPSPSERRPCHIVLVDIAAHLVTVIRVVISSPYRLTLPRIMNGGPRKIYAKKREI